MRLTTLTLEHYGPFDRLALCLDPAPGRINLILAPNGAGKSVLRQAFGDLLFGIPVRSPLTFRYPGPTMRLRAEALDASRRVVRFGRRKGQGNTLLDEADQPLPQAVLDRLLGRADRDVLERLFALDTERLRKGGADLRASGGDFAEALLAGAGGVRQARALADALQAARDKIAPTHKTASRPFYRALDELVASRKRRQEATLRPEAWEKRQAALTDARGAQAAANETARARAAALARLERIRRVRPLLAELDEAEAWLAANADAPSLPVGLAARLAAAREAIRRAADASEAAAARVEAARRALAAEAPDAALLAEAEAVAALLERAGAVRQAAADLPGVAGDLAAARRRVAETLRALGSDLPPEQAATLLPARPALAEARGLIARYGQLRALLDEAPARLSAAETAHAEARAGFDALPEPAEDAALAALAREIRAEGEPGPRAEEAAQRAEAAAREAALALARVSGWPHGLAALAALGPPALAVFERLDQERAEAARAVAALRDRAARARAALAETERQAAEVAAGGMLPDEAAIAAARARRDEGWHLIHRRAFGDAPPDAGTEAAWAGDAPLPLAYERAVAAADALADRRAGEAERLARAAELARTRAGQAAVARDLERELAEAEAAHAASAARWDAGCARLGGEAPPGGVRTLAELRDFLTRREAALLAGQAAEAEAARRDALAARHAAWAGRLARTLAAGAAASAAGVSGGPASFRGEKIGAAMSARIGAESGAVIGAGIGAEIGAEIGARSGAAGTGDAAALSALLHQADAALDRVRRLREARAVAADRLRAAEGALTQARAEQAGLAERRETWRAAWDAALAALRRPPEETPEAVAEALALFEDLAKAVVKAEDLADRVQGMRARIDTFGVDFAALAARVTPDLAGAEPLDAAATLRARLDDARRIATRRDQCREALDRAEADAATARHRLAEAEAEASAVRAAAGAEDDAEAEARIRRADERAAHVATRAAAEAKLHEAGDGLALAALRAEAAAVPADGLAVRLDEARREQEEAGEAAQRAAAEASRIESELARELAADAVTEAAAAEEAAIAALDHSLEEALLLHAAAALLQQGLQAVGTGADAALLGRIGERFAGLTEDAYPRLEVREDDAGRPRLFAIARGFPDEACRPDELSEGTRDQLYLALRLVAIEDHAAGGVALPFLADDVLQTFDDTRALAALRALLTLSESVQVIVLTHHPHLLGLLAHLPPGSAHVVRGLVEKGQGSALDPLGPYGPRPY